MYRQRDLAFINIWRSAEKLHFIQPYWREEEKLQKKSTGRRKGRWWWWRVREEGKELKKRKKKGRHKEEVGKKTKTIEQLEKAMQAWLTSLAICTHVHFAFYHPFNRYTQSIFFLSFFKFHFQLHLICSFPRQCFTVIHCQKWHTHTHTNHCAHIQTHPQFFSQTSQNIHFNNA